MYDAFSHHVEYLLGYATLADAELAVATWHTHLTEDRRHNQSAIACHRSPSRSITSVIVIHLNPSTLSVWSVI